MLLAHHLLWETPPSPGLTTETLVTLEPRRRVRLPEEAMSEGAHHTETPAFRALRPSDQRRPGPPSQRQGRSVPTREAARRRGGSKRHSQFKRYSPLAMKRTTLAVLLFLLVIRSALPCSSPITSRKRRRLRGLQPGPPCQRQGRRAPTREAARRRGGSKRDYRSECYGAPARSVVDPPPFSEIR
jgi:hypothetical protein